MELQPCLPPRPFNPRSARFPSQNDPMLETPHLTQIEKHPTALIHLTIPRAEIQSVMGPGLRELMSTVASQGSAPTGPWFTHHLAIEPDSWNFEISVPVSTPLLPAGRVKPGEWPAMKAARTVYHGPYEGLGDAWSEFLHWIETNGHTPSPDLYERYLVGPETSENPGDWRTELIKPLTP